MAFKAKDIEVLRYLSKTKLSYQIYLKQCCLITLSLDVFTINFTKCFPTLAGIMILNKFGLKKPKKQKFGLQL